MCFWRFIRFFRSFLKEEEAGFEWRGIFNLIFYRGWRVDWRDRKEI